MLRCIRFGEVLLDETFRTFLICNQCQTEFVEIPEFRVHLATSACGQRLFKDDVLGLKFGAAQVTRASKEKTYLLYNPADVQIATTESAINNATSTTEGGDDAYLDLMKIEEELLDPRWYTDIANAQPDVESPQHTASLPTAANTNKSLEYKELVEAVGPYVQFKDSAPKEKQSRIVVRHFSTKSNNSCAVPAAPPAAPAAEAVPKNPVVPVKRDATTDKPAARLMNPAAKRKLELTPKQVHFKDEVCVKYVISETLCTDDKRARSLGNENNEKISTGDGAIPKRRKTINIPMDQASIHLDLQEQSGGHCPAVPKAAVEKVGTKSTVATISATGTKIAGKTNSGGNLAGNPKLKSNAAAKTVTTTIAPKCDVQANSKNLVPNPLVIQKQINGTKNQMTNNVVLVKNPVSYSRSNSNCMKKEKPLATTKAPTLANKAAVPVVARPQQRAPSATAKPPMVQPTKFTSTNHIIPPVLAPLSSNKISNPTALAATKADPNDAQQQTNDILNKLQTRGLQVKRTQPLMAPPATTTSSACQQQNKTMELLQKLQSKGMKVKILNGKETASGAAATQLNASINLPTTIANTKRMSDVGNVTTGIGTQNKKILNNKLTIKKVK